MIAVSTVLPIVALALFTGVILAVLLRLFGFLLALAGLMVAFLWLWLAGNGHGPSLGQFILVMVSLQAGYLGGVLLVAGRMRAAGWHSRAAPGGAADRHTHAGLE